MNFFQKIICSVLGITKELEKIENKIPCETELRKMIGEAIVDCFQGRPDRYWGYYSGKNSFKEEIQEHINKIFISSSSFEEIKKKMDEVEKEDFIDKVVNRIRVKQLPRS